MGETRLFASPGVLKGLLAWYTSMVKPALGKLGTVRGWLMEPTLASALFLVGILKVLGCAYMHHNVPWETHCARSLLTNLLAGPTAVGLQVTKL